MAYVHSHFETLVMQPPKRHFSAKVTVALLDSANLPIGIYERLTRSQTLVRNTLHTRKLSCNTQLGDISNRRTVLLTARFC